MIRKVCAICGPKAPSKVLYKKNFSKKQINENIFSARRLPDGVHYQILKCLKCGLIFSSPIFPNKTLQKLYKGSKVTYGEQIQDLTKTYGYYLKELKNYGVKKDRLLEIGCGDGFFLAEAKKQGYREVYGVEPSCEAIKKAPKDIGKHIKNDLFKKGLFPKNFFSVICFFQTFDHVSNPNEFLKNCFTILKPGGIILAFNHNTDSFQASLLGEKSPIIDIEHTYLYGLRTMRKIFEKNSYQVVKIEPSFNIYSLDYILHLVPLPQPFKEFLFLVLRNLKVSGMKFKLRIGNMVLLAKKPVLPGDYLAQ